jgi:ATP-dependent Lhr-like helicase
MDTAGLERLLARIEAGEIGIAARDLVEPSPLALEVLAARPYAYLDDAPLEERRTQAVIGRRWLTPEAADELGRLDPEAIQRVRGETWPEPDNPDELHDALVWLGFLTNEEAAGWNEWLAALAAERKRCARLDRRLWIAAERLPLFLALFPATGLDPPVAAPDGYDRVWERDAALVEILRGRLEGQGPATRGALGEALSLDGGEIAAALAALEAEGFALRGRFSADAGADEWCERRLLARIHRYTINRLRAEIEPVAARDFLRFLFEWQRAAPEARMEGPDALAAVIGQLEGFQAPAGAWETEILPARLAEYEPAWLDEQCLAGRLAWARLRQPVGRAGERSAGPVRSTPIAFAAAPPDGAVGGLGAGPGDGNAEPPRVRRRRLHRRARRLVLRRDRRRYPPPGAAGRGGARRAGGARHRHRGQLCRVARAPPAVRQALASQPAPGDLRHGGCRPLGSGPSWRGSSRR